MPPPVAAQTDKTTADLAREADARSRRAEAIANQASAAEKALEDHVHKVDEINIDKDAANDIAKDWLRHAVIELNAQVLMLTSATNKFRDFVDLPPPQVTSVWAQVFQTLIGVGSLVFPALGLLKFLKTEEELVKAEAALQVAAKLGSKQAKAIQLGRKAAEFNENVIKKAKESLEKIKGEKKGEKGKEGEKKGGTGLPPEVDAILAKADATRGPIRQLLASAAKAGDLWRHALDVLHEAYANRVRDTGAPQKESLSKMAERLLKDPPSSTPDELDQFERRYLWEMIKRWMQGGAVKIVKTQIIIDGKPDRHPSEKIVGLNDNQKRALVEFFGPGVPRDNIFPMPPVMAWFWFVYSADVPTEVQTEYVDSYKYRRQPGEV